MPKRTLSFTHQVRSVLAAAKGEPLTTARIAEPLDLISGEYGRIYRALTDLRKSGEVERIKPGLYRYIGKPRKPDKRRVMWNILRARKTVTVDDLQELAGASRPYARQWLKMLVDKEVVRKLQNGRCQLVTDTVQMPEDDAKAAYLRALRRQKKAAIAGIDAAMNALLDARQQIVGIKEAHDE